MTDPWGDLEDDDCEDVEFVHLSHEELVAAQRELNHLRSEMMRNLNAR